MFFWSKTQSCLVIMSSAADEWKYKLMECKEKGGSRSKSELKKVINTEVNICILHWFL